MTSRQRRGRLALVPDGDAPRGTIVTVIGPPESGKSRLLWHQYTRHQPRKLTIEVVDDRRVRDGDQGARRVYGYAATVAELRECAELASWHVVTSLERDEIERLFWLLCPPLRSPHTVSFAKAVGGLTVACGELKHVAPRNLSELSPIADALLRYRHHWLTIHGATQHAPHCHESTRLSADRLVLLRTSDKLALDAIARATTPELAELARDLEPYHSLTCIKSIGRAYLADDRYRVSAVLDYRGRPVAATAGALAGVTSSADARTSARVAGGTSIRA